MRRFEEIRNEQGDIVEINTILTGKALLSAAKLNKGCAFSYEERRHFNLLGKLPRRVETLDEQVTRMYAQYQGQPTALSKNIWLHSLRDYNETLFYKLVSEHFAEMLPILYTPTVGQAVQNFSSEMRRHRGIYIAYPNMDYMEEMLGNRLNPDVDLIVVTDGEGVLGIGDQGVGGMDIPIAKLMVYTLCANVHPHKVLPIQLDVGTNNQKLLDDPMYLGWRHERIIGEEYDVFIDNFVQTIKKMFPKVYLHWEDFGRENARKILTKYRNDLCTFNDDMQGTGCVTLASVLAGANATGVPLDKHRIVIFGAGTAGVGIADQIRDAMMRNGLSEEEAYKRFWLIDREGLLSDDMPGMMGFQTPYARPAEERADWECEKSFAQLSDVVANIYPTVLIGCSAVKGAFTESIIRNMAAHTKRPIVLPLSNPTTKAEATPKDILEWSKGKALIASGSPFEPVYYNGKTIRISQNNNALVFPGIGLGVIAGKINRVSDDLLWAACESLADHSPAKTDPDAPLLPDLNDVQHISHDIAIAVMKQGIKEGSAQIPPDADLEKLIHAVSWTPKYVPYHCVASLE